MIWILAYLCTGVFVGFLAGLLGIGGGMVMVPILAALFAAQGFAPDHVLHLALGTSMAVILFTASSSAREHHRLVSVDWSVVQRMAPGIALGTLMASWGSALVPQQAMAGAFAVIVIAAATQIGFGRKPSAGRALPGPLGTGIVGVLIGIVCGLVSVGGAFMTVPFMLWCGVPARTAIGTGAALGLPIALMGTAGYAVAGWSVPGLPAGSVGFVQTVALASVVVTSMLLAPVGARLAHRLPVATLRKIFALMLYAVAVKTLWAFA